MSNSDHLSESYFSAALQTLEQAYAHNYDDKLGISISKVIDSLREVMNQVAISESTNERESSSPYEINDFNSAI